MDDRVTKRYKIIHGQRVLVTICPPAIADGVVPNLHSDSNSSRKVLESGCYHKKKLSPRYSDIITGPQKTGGTM